VADEDTLDQEEEEAPQLDPKAVAKLQKELAKAREEAKKSRLELRKAEVREEFGADIVELIPDELPQEKWAEFAGKLKEKLAPSAEQEQAPEQEAEAPQTGSEAALAAVAAPSPASAQAPADQKTPREIYEIGLQNPAEAERLLRENRMAPATPAPWPEAKPSR
jgi:hypothetical protein